LRFTQFSGSIIQQITVKTAGKADTRRPVTCATSLTEEIFFEARLKQASLKQFSPICLQEAKLHGNGINNKTKEA